MLEKQNIKLLAAQLYLPSCFFFFSKMKLSQKPTLKYLQTVFFRQGLRPSLHS